MSDNQKQAVSFALLIIGLVTLGMAIHELLNNLR